MRHRALRNGRGAKIRLFHRTSIFQREGNDKTSLAGAITGKRHIGSTLVGNDLDVDFSIDEDANLKSASQGVAIKCPAGQ